ncbi:MAG TPA: hypothetical protein VEA60_16105, partial [Allosphingosinicella sp.]|nr:hypothetical protein [Allosphingosinicella sp.]
MLFLALLFTGAVIDRLEAQPRRPRPADTASQTALIDTLTIQRAAERAATEAAWSARYGDALRRIEQTVQQRRAEARRRARAEAAQLRAEGRVGELESKLLAADRKYAEAIAERQSLVEELGRQSRAFEAETAAYRSLMTRFVADASPEKL